MLKIVDNEQAYAHSTLWPCRSKCGCYDHDFSSVFKEFEECVNYMFNVLESSSLGRDSHLIVSSAGRVGRVSDITDTSF